MENYKINNDLTVEYKGKTYKLMEDHHYDTCTKCPFQKDECRAGSFADGKCRIICKLVYCASEKQPVFDLDECAFVEIKDENETEAGTTMVIVTRTTKLAIAGSWKLSGGWMEQFRRYRQADTVTVEAYYPSSRSLSSYECQFEITKETHLTKARGQLAHRNGLYEVEVKITEL